MVSVSRQDTYGATSLLDMGERKVSRRQKMTHVCSLKLGTHEKGDGEVEKHMMRPRMGWGTRGRRKMWLPNPLREA